jgi:hypothetical protein
MEHGNVNLSIILLIVHSPNLTSYRFETPDPETAPPARETPHRGACATHQPRWAGGTSTPDSALHGGHLERQNAQDGLAMTRRR